MSHLVYTAWNADAEPVYVGCTNNLARRMTQHGRAWWMRGVSYVSWERIADKGDAYSYEASRIRELEPLGNRRGNPRWSRWLAENGAVR